MNIDLFGGTITNSPPPVKTWRDLLPAPKPRWYWQTDEYPYQYYVFTDKDFSHLGHRRLTLEQYNVVFEQFCNEAHKRYNTFIGQTKMTMRYFYHDETESVEYTDSEKAAKVYLESGDFTELSREDYLEYCAAGGFTPVDESNKTKQIEMAVGLPNEKGSKSKTSATKKNSEKSPIQPVIDGIKFCAMANIDSDVSYQKHVKVSNSWAVSFDSVVAMGHPIPLAFESVPHTVQLLAALNKVGADASFTVADDSLTVRGARLRAAVACLDFDSMPPVSPDPPVAAADERLRSALVTAGTFTVDGTDDVVSSSVMLRNQTAVGTNRQAMIEAFHGIQIPFAMIVPKKFVSILAKIGKEIAKIGGSPRSLTVYFKDDSWIKTQLYSDPWPDVDGILNETPGAIVDMPEGFFDGVKTILPFVDEYSRCYLLGSVMATHIDNHKGASFDIHGIPTGLVLNAKHLAKLDGLFDKADLFSRSNRAFFYSATTRAILVGMQQ